MSGVPVMGIVKANAYGHGLVPVARHLEAQGIAQLGVAFVEEGTGAAPSGSNVYRYWCWAASTRRR